MSSNDFIYPDMNTVQRVEALKKIAVKVATMTYQRSLTDEEIDMEKDRYCQDTIERDKKKDEAKAVSQTFKNTIESMEKMMSERLDRIRTGQTELCGEVYLVADQAKGRMNYYDKYGEKVNSRDLTMDERQGRLFIGDGVTDDSKVEDLEHEDVEEIQDAEFETDDDGEERPDDDECPI